MTARLKVLDLFCCEGGAGVGYQRAGLSPYGVDLDRNRLKRYPFPIHYGDALVVLATFAAGGKVDFLHPDGRVEWLGAGDFVLKHASPPCQYYTRGNAGKVTAWPQLIAPTREAFEAIGGPYVIENVVDAGWDMRDPILLCGCMFDLSVRDYSCSAPGQHTGTCDTVNGVLVHLERGRLFETNWDLVAPRRCEGEGQPRNNHPTHDWVAGAYGGARRDKHDARYVRRGGYVPPDMTTVKTLLGVEHDMTWRGLFESIPPAYTEHIARQLICCTAATTALLEISR